MRGRSRIAAVGLLAMTVCGAMSSAAGAQSASQWSVQANGGFVSLEPAQHVAGLRRWLGSRRQQRTMAEASGTGACFSTCGLVEPVPDQRSLVALGRRRRQHPGRRGQRATARRPTADRSEQLPVPDRHAALRRRRRRRAARRRRPRTPTGTRRRRAPAASPTPSLEPEPDRRPAAICAAGAALGVVAVLRRRAGRHHHRRARTRARCRRPVQRLLGTVNGILPANLALNATSVAGGRRRRRRVLGRERAADPARRGRRVLAGHRRSSPAS